jgi:tetratricopeptide (TPR) repeat protein
MLPEILMVGTTVSHYTILTRLGGGGMGVVYKAEDTRLDRSVALKFLPPDLTRDAEAKARFIHEAKAASALQHNNICVVHDIDESADGQLFIVMDFYEGVTLKTKIDQGPLKIDEALDIAMQVAQGLQKAHEHMMVHRDIKPANVMITTDGVAKIVDFGLAKLSSMTRLTKTGATLGTIGYMSPEQTRGETVDHRTDIWSLGVMVYEMLTGALPFKGEYENAVVYSILNTQPEPLTGVRTGVPMELERIVDKAMAKDPAERYQHVDELLVDLRRIAKQHELAAGSREARFEAHGGAASSHSAGVTSQRAAAASNGTAGAFQAGTPASQMATPPHDASVPTPGNGIRHRWKSIAFAGAVGLGLVAAFFVLKPFLFDATLDAEPSPIAVVSFVNQTGDKTYDYLGEAIPNLLITSLEQSRYLRVMTWERMRDLLTQMGKRDVAIIDKELGFELCRREGVRAIVVGSFVKAGETFVTDAKVLDVETKELLKSASTRGEGVQSILDDQIDDLSREIARGVGLSRQKIESVPAQIADVTTSSMEAYNYFLRGRDDYEKFYYKQSREFLEKAIALDTMFAMAHLYLADATGAIFDFKTNRKALAKAKELSSRAPEKERLYIEARYAGTIESNPGKRSELLEELVFKYPKEKRFRYELGVNYRSHNRLKESQREVEAALQLDPSFGPAINILAYLLADQEQYEKAIEAYRRYASVSPGDANPFDSMGEVYLRMGKLDQSIALYQEALRVKPDFHGSYNGLAYVFALKEEYGRAIACIDTLVSIAPSPFLKAAGHAWAGIYAKYLGRFREAERRVTLMEDIVRRTNMLQHMTPVLFMKFWNAIQRGVMDEARRELLAFTDLYNRNSPGTPVRNMFFQEILFCYLETTSNRIDSARARLTVAMHNVDSVRDVWGGTLLLFKGMVEGELLLAEHLPDSAIHVVRTTRVPGPAMTTGYQLPMYTVPYLKDIVPRAFLMKGQPDSAIAEYKKLLTIDPAARDRRLINPLYHYRLANLYEQTGATDDAVREYTRFLSIWKDADRDQPDYVDARKRLALLARRQGVSNR